MLDNEGRITIRKELLEICNMQNCKKVYLFLNVEQNRIFIYNRLVDFKYPICFVKSTNIDDKGRMYVPDSIICAFKDSSFIPVSDANDINIIIIKH